MKTVIIGGGVAGLTAGIYGQLLGMDCTIIEKNAFIGGNMTAWKRNGYPIDNCIHWLTGTKDGTELNRTWKTVGMLGKNVKLCKNDAFYTSELEGKSVSLWRDTEKTLAEMKKISFVDAEESKRFIECVNRIANAGRNSMKEKLSYTLAVIRYGRMSLGDLSNRFSHPLLKRLVVDYLSPELSALALVFAYAAFASGNGDVPYGGSRDAALRMKNRFLSLGGRILLCEQATRIVINKARERAIGVITERGRFVAADNVICTCDPTVTFGRLLPRSYMPTSMERAYKDSKRMPLFSAVHAAFACDSTEELPKSTTVFEVDGVKIGSRTVRRMIVKPYTSDELNIFKGKTVIQVIFYLYEKEAALWEQLSNNQEKYKKAKEDFARSVLHATLKRYPSIKDSVELLDVWTPATYIKYFNAKRGAFLSFASKPGKALCYRAPSKIKGLSNVYLATQWQSSPGGLPVAANNGKKAIYLISQ